MTKIYVIIKSVGEYSDREVTVVRAVSTESRAQELVLELDKESRKDFVVYDMTNRYHTSYIKQNPPPDYKINNNEYTEWSKECLVAREEYEKSIDRNSLKLPTDRIYYDTCYDYEELELED